MGGLARLHRPQLFAFLVVNFLQPAIYLFLCINFTFLIIPLNKQNDIIWFTRQVITMQCGAGLCYQDIPNQIYVALKKNEHFEVYLRYIISILINDGPEMAC